MTPTLHIQLLGEFFLEYGSDPLAGVNTPRLQSLLAYLLLHRGAPQSRSHIAFQFWPDSTEAQARSNLRTLLHRLRRALPRDDQFLFADAQTLQWQADSAFSLDVAKFENLLTRAETAAQAGELATERGALEQAMALYQGDLLPSCYDDWLLSQRERLLQTYIGSLERLIQLLEEERAYEEAIGYARQLVRHEPLHEAGYRRLMRLRALQGDRAGALRVYHACATTLERELGVEPSPPTQRVYEDLLQAETRPLPVVGGAAGVLPLVGREEEWALLQKAWQRAARGPRFALLLGEAGIGKTRLVEELLEWARQQGIAQAYARCYAAEGELAYAPVTALLQARPLPPLDDVWLTEVARLLPEVLVERPDLPPPRPMTEAWQRQRLFQALARAVLGNIPAPEPLLLALEDLHWCERESLDWLHFLLRFDPRARLLVVGTCRPEEMDGDCAFAATLPTLHRDVRLREIELGPLDEAQTATLATHLAGETIDVADATRLYRETEGNPLFVVETLRAGLPALQEEAGSQRVRLPPRMQAVLQTRLAQLSPSGRDLAGLAATIGRSFSVTVLARAIETDQDALVQGLDELWQRRIVRERGADGYDFTHDKLREAAYNMLSPARRRLLHRRVAQALESLHGSDTDAVARRVAVHYDRAGQPEQAIPLYLQAGQVAAKIYAHQEAVASFQRGLALLEEGNWDAAQHVWRREMAAGLYEGLGDAQQLSHPDEARQAYQKALNETAPEDRFQQVRLQRKIGVTWNAQGQFDRALETYNLAETYLGPEPGDIPAAWRREWAELQYARYYPLYALARWREVQSVFELLQPIVEEHGTPLDRARFHAGRMTVALRRDRYVISEATLADARNLMDAFRNTGMLSLVSEFSFYLGWFLVLCGELDEAEEPLQTARVVGERIAYPLYCAWALIWLTVLHRKRGRLAEVRQYARDALAVSTEAGIPAQIGMAQANLAWVAWCKGDLDQAEELGQAALASWQRSQWVYAFQWAARCPLLAMALEKDQVSAALEHALVLLDPLQQKLPDPLEAALEAAVRAGAAQQPAEAGARLRHAVQVAQETGFL